MLNRTWKMAVLILGLTMIGIMVVPIRVNAAPSTMSDGFTAKLQSFDVDEFTYRVSFHLEDGTESFLIRSRFGLTYLYQHHQPTVTQHHMWGLIGFYYGKTALGRSIIQNLEFDSIAFYPIWQDIKGVYHNLKGERALFEITDSIADGKMIGGSMLLDAWAPSKFVHLMGGTLVINNLVLDMGGGVEIAMGTIEIEIIKHYNEELPYAATMESEQNLSYSSDFSYLIAVGSGVAPFLVALDAALGVSIFGAIIVFAALIVLHVKGRIRLPVDKLGHLMSRTSG